MLANAMIPNSINKFCVYWINTNRIMLQFDSYFLPHNNKKGIRIYNCWKIVNWFAIIQRGRLASHIDKQVDWLSYSSKFYTSYN